MACYTLQAANVPEAPGLVFRLLTLPQLHSRWGAGGGVAGGASPAAFATGQRWTERREGILFLRPVITCEVLCCDPTTRSFVTRLDDGYNVVVTEFTVDPAAGESSSSTITQRVQCYTRSAAPGRLLPSDKLAAMWLKHDQTLAQCVDYLQPAAHHHHSSSGGSPRGTVRLSSSLWDAGQSELQLVPAAVVAAV